MEEKEAEGLTDQEQKLQKDKECVIYIATISEEEESNTETDSDESPYFF